MGEGVLSAPVSSPFYPQALVGFESNAAGSRMDRRRDRFRTTEPVSRVVKFRAISERCTTFRGGWEARFAPGEKTSEANPPRSSRVINLGEKCRRRDGERLLASPSLRSRGRQREGAEAERDPAMGPRTRMLLSFAPRADDSGHLRSSRLLASRRSALAARRLPSNLDPRFPQTVDSLGVPLVLPRDC